MSKFDFTNGRAQILKALVPYELDNNAYDLVKAALDLIEKGKVQKKTFKEYIVNYIGERSKDQLHFDYIEDGEFTPEDCLFFFKKHGLKIIE